MFIELHARSAYSFLRGASSPDALAAACAETGVTAMAVCDRDGVYGAPRFYAAAREHGIRPIVGCELTMADMTVLPVVVKTRTGYRNLCRLLTRAQLRAEKGKSRVGWEELSGYTEGLAVLTGDEEGPLYKAWAEGRAGTAEAKAVIGRLRRSFGPGDLYVEVQRHLLRGEQRWLRFCRDLAEAERLPLLASNGVTCARPEGRKVQDIFTCLREKVRIDEAGTLLSRNDQRHVKGTKAMDRLFSDLPEAIANTQRLGEEIEFSLEDLGYEFPRYRVPAGETMDSFLHKITWFGAEQRYGSLSPAVRKQLRRELDLIRKLGFSGYFLIVWDLVNYCRENEIMVQGRGSAANSAVCYSLGITPVDPVGGKLLFERFLSEGRKSWPDIDLDLPSGDRREAVIQEVYQRYGRHGAAMTANVITYQGRSTIREIGKVLNFPDEMLNRFSSLFAHGGFPHTLELREQLKKAGLPENHPRARCLFELYKLIHGLPRHLGQHSGGMIICEGQLDQIVPLENASMPGRVVAQWDKEGCENMGIVKVDLLGLGMMAAMQDAFAMIRERGVPIDLASIPKDDAPTYDLMQRADTVGTFQVESRAQMATLPRMKPKCFYDVVVEVAIIRPGPIQGKMVNPYLERRAGKAPVEYFDDRLIPVLERTLGIPLFQEQILKMAMIMADISGSEAEDLRRAISFYRNFERIEIVVAKLIDRMREKEEPEETIRKVVESISSFSNYGFPESHAISFGILAYASCYLKVHYPAEFFAALLNNQPMGFYAPATLVQDARRRGLRILPVCVNASEWECTVVDPSTIRLGLCRVNGVSHRHAIEMLDARSQSPFASLRDFRLRTGFDRDECRRLAAIGALNTFAENRRDALWAVEELIDREGLFARHGAEDGPGGESADSPLQPMNPRERLAADYAGTGLTVGSHPMGSLRPHLPGILTARDLESGEDGAWVTIAGQVICRQRPGTAKGFVFISMEDETGISNTIVTPKFLEAYRLTITQERYLKISGRLQSQDGVIHVKAQKIEALTVADLPASASYDFH